MKDPVFRMAVRLRALLRKAMTQVGSCKTSKTFEMVGYAPEELRNHLESRFVDGIGWHNMDQWHIDHIIPISLAETIEDVIELNQLDNLQPLWAEINIVKSDKLNFDIDEILCKREQL